MLRKVIMVAMLLGMPSLFAMSLSQLNSATKEELMQINGIGEAKAKAILKERKKGKFKSFDDLQRVDGIGEQTAANVKSNVKSKADVKKVKKSTKKKSTKKVDSSTSKTKTKRKIKSMDEKKKELKTKSKKTKEKKTKTKNK